MHAIQTSLTAASSRMTANSSPLQEEEEQEQHDLEDEDVDMEEAERLADERMGYVENGGQQQHSRPRTRAAMENRRNSGRPTSHALHTATCAAQQHAVLKLLCAPPAR